MSKDKSIKRSDLPAATGKDKTKQPEEFIDNNSWQGVDKAPGEESARAEKASFRDLKNKKTDTELSADHKTGGR